MLWPSLNLAQYALLLRPTCYSATRIRVTRFGISSGKKKLPWQSVTQIETLGYGIHIHATGKKIVIAPWAYQDPEALIAFIQAQFQGKRR